MRKIILRKWILNMDNNYNIFKIILKNIWVVCLDIKKRRKMMVDTWINWLGPLLKINFAKFPNLPKIREEEDRL